MILLYTQGLYPEYHGIVTNFFFDKDLNETYMMSNEPQWWAGEPVRIIMCG